MIPGWQGSGEKGGIEEELKENIQVSGVALCS
jgi:hypothetical protein